MTIDYNTTNKAELTKENPVYLKDGCTIKRIHLNEEGNMRYDRVSEWTVLNGISFSNNNHCHQSDLTGTMTTAEEYRSMLLKVYDHLFNIIEK